MGPIACQTIQHRKLPLIWPIPFLLIFWVGFFPSSIHAEEIIDYNLHLRFDSKKSELIAEDIITFPKTFLPSKGGVHWDFDKCLIGTS